MKQYTQKRQDWIRGRREKRKLARQARIRRQLLRYTLLLGLIAGGVAAFLYLPWSLQKAPAEMVIQGNQVVSDEQIRTALQSAIGQPLYRLNPGNLEKKVAALPPVAYCFVRRSAFPTPRLRVQVIEEFPWASFCSSPDAEPEAVIAQSGRFIPIKDYPGVVRPHLKFCGNADFHLNSSGIAAWDGWVRFIAQQLGKPVELVDVRQPNRIVVDCGDTHLCIGQADSTLFHRLGRIASILPVVNSLGNNLKYVDLSFSSNVPLKINRAGSTPARDEEVLKEAANAIASVR